VTVDGYIVKIKNRIVLTGQFGSDVTAIAPYLAQFNVSQVQFFANAVNTTNTGLDMVLDYNKRWGRNNLKISLAGNLQNITLIISAYLLRLMIVTCTNRHFTAQESNIS